LDGFYVLYTAAILKIAKGKEVKLLVVIWPWVADSATRVWFLLTAAPAHSVRQAKRRSMRPKYLSALIGAVGQSIPGKSRLPMPAQPVYCLLRITPI